jgi:hypothetical protein
MRALVAGDIPSQGANPTGTIGLAVSNGTSASYLRCDCSLPLSVAITPTWTGAHIYNAALTVGSGTTYPTFTCHGPSGDLSISDSIISTTRDTLYFNYPAARVYDFNNGQYVMNTVGLLQFKGSGCGILFSERSTQTNLWFQYADTSTYRLSDQSADLLTVARTTGNATLAGRLIATKGLGAFGVTPPATQPATPVTLANVITLLQNAGLCA